MPLRTVATVRKPPNLRGWYLPLGKPSARLPGPVLESSPPGPRPLLAFARRARVGYKRRLPRQSLREKLQTACVLLRHLPLVIKLFFMTPLREPGLTPNGSSDHRCSPQYSRHDFRSVHTPLRSLNHSIFKPAPQPNRRAPARTSTRPKAVSSYPPPPAIFRIVFIVALCVIVRAALFRFTHSFVATDGECRRRHHREARTHQA